MKVKVMLERADEFLSGAEEAVASERYNLAALCSYAALFWAAMAALAYFGVRVDRIDKGGMP